MSNNDDNAVVLTFGTWDLLHVGHIRMLKRAKELSSGKLIVGVSSDSLSYHKKGRMPVFSEEDRMEIVRSVRYVDSVFLEKSLDLKPYYATEHGADLLVMGDDWKGRFDWVADAVAMPLKVIYLPRTPSVSTTELIHQIRRDDL